MTNLSYPSTETAVPVLERFCLTRPPLRAALSAGLTVGIVELVVLEELTALHLAHQPVELGQQRVRHVETVQSDVSRSHRPLITVD